EMNDDEDDDWDDPVEADPNDESEMPCPDCGRLIYDDVDVCPYCGYFILDSDRTYPSLLNATWFRWLGLLGIILLLISMILPLFF
ncbi:MAG: zinc-ribbon domain-containing protein, partial [Planctomycetaceae bacterium]|nr:zinc-ribbon domain-containing protein [Planctomycetaceae bacterium]